MEVISNWNKMHDCTATIASYTCVIETNYKPQEGTVLILCATAYPQWEFQHQQLLRETVRDLSKTVPDPLVLGKVWPTTTLTLPSPCWIWSLPIPRPRNFNSER